MKLFGNYIFPRQIILFSSGILFLGSTTYGVHRSIKNNQTPPSKEQVEALEEYIRYLRNEKANNETFQKGWFVTGDIGVVYPDGYIEIKDRSKDVIISGGENINSLELEGVLYKHPAVKEVAVVAMPHQRWGESPCAFIVLKEEFRKVTEDEIFAHCRKNLAGYMMPKKVHFMKELNKSATGKIRKVELRALAKKLAAMDEEKSRGPISSWL